MALNTNHTVEDLNEVKCAVVEKNVSKERAEFLRYLLEGNNFTVLVVPSPPPKAAKTAAPVEEPPAAETDRVTVASTFTVGVTDVCFNAVNAVFGRLLKSPKGHVVTLAYWNQKESEAHDEIPYYENKK